MREKIQHGPCGPVVKRRQQQDLDSHSAHHRVTATCGKYKEGGLERKRHLSGALVTATPGLSRLPVHPTTSRRLPHGGRSFSLTPPRRTWGPGRGGKTTSPEEEGERDSEGMTAARSEAAQSGLAVRKEEEGEQGWGPGPRSGLGQRSGVRGRAGGQWGGSARAPSAACPPILPPSLSFMILKQPSSLGWRPQETSHLGNKTVSWRP